MNDVTENNEDKGTTVLARAIWNASQKSSGTSTKDLAARKEAWGKERRNMMKIAKTTLRALNKNGYDMVAKSE